MKTTRPPTPDARDRSSRSARAENRFQAHHIPRDLHEPVFQEPWQAEVFAIVLSLHEHGVFTWTEWAAMLSQKIRRVQHNGDADLGDTYYNHWLSALERIRVAKDIGIESPLANLYSRWNKAAQLTPYGQPIKLS